MTRDHRIRFAANSFVSSDTTLLNSSTNDVGFDLSNALNNTRHLLWQDSGLDSGNASLYIDYYNQILYADSVAYEITPGNYTIDQLDTELKTHNASWGVSRNVSGIITLDLGSSTTLNFSSTSRSIWYTLGMDYINDVTATSVSGVAPVYRGKMVAEFDLGFEAPIGMVAIIGKIDEAIPLSSGSSINLLVSSTIAEGSWLTPAETLVMEVQDGGAFKFLDSETGLPLYRYIRLEINERSNPDPVYISNLYVGDYLSPIKTNLSRGFTRSIEDGSTKSVAVSGTRFYSNRPKKFAFSSMNILYLTIEERQDLEQLFFDVGVGKAFYISLDPLGNVSENESDTTKLVNFTSSPVLSHVFADRYSIQFQVEEVI